MSYRIQGCYRADGVIDFKDVSPVKNIEVKTFVMEFPDYIPFQEAKREVKKRANELYEIESKKRRQER